MPASLLEEKIIRSLLKSNPVTKLIPQIFISKGDRGFFIIKKYLVEQKEILGSFTFLRNAQYWIPA